MHETKWFMGCPPFAGWWLTITVHSTSENGMPMERIAWRWWSGHWWSEPVVSAANANNAAMRANKPWRRPSGCNLVWSFYWPTNARVPRIDPRAG